MSPFREREADRSSPERCSACFSALNKDEPTRRCADGHVAIHEGCRELLESCPALDCGRELTGSAEGLTAEPSVDAEAKPRTPRCPVCGEDFMAGEDVLACAEAHVAVHADCHTEGLVERCPALGCEGELARHAVEAKGPMHLVLARPELDAAARELAAAEASARLARPTARDRLEQRRAIRARRRILRDRLIALRESRVRSGTFIWLMFTLLPVAIAVQLITGRGGYVFAGGVLTAWLILILRGMTLWARERRRPATSDADARESDPRRVYSFFGLDRDLFR